MLINATIHSLKAQANRLQNIHDGYHGYQMQPSKNKLKVTQSDLQMAWSQIRFLEKTRDNRNE